MNETQVRRWLLERLAESLGIGVDEIDESAPFTDSGLDSMEAFVVTGDLADRFGVELPPTLLWDHPSVAEVARYVASLSSGGGDASR